MRDVETTCGLFESAGAGAGLSVLSSARRNNAPAPLNAEQRRSESATVARALPDELVLPLGGFEEIDFRYDPVERTAWSSMRPYGPPCFSRSLMQELNQLHDSITRISAQATEKEAAWPLFYVGRSSHPNVFNLGGDLRYFIDCVKSSDEQGLRAYAHACVKTIHDMDSGLGGKTVTICIVQGDALGGGFEGAMSFNLLVAERGAKMGLPEALFNAFPGMGAFSLLSRKIGQVKAREMMINGKIYTAEDLYEMGVVNILAERGRGVETVRQYIRDNAQRHSVLLALERVRRRVQPVSMEELVDVTDIWVDTVMSLTPADLRRMEVLLAAQTKRTIRERS